MSPLIQGSWTKIFIGMQTSQLKQYNATWITVNYSIFANKQTNINIIIITLTISNAP